MENITNNILVCFLDTLYIDRGKLFQFSTGLLGSFGLKIGFKILNTNFKNL